MNTDPSTPEAQPCIVSDAMTCWRRPDGTPARPEYGGVVQAKDWQAFAALAAEQEDAADAADALAAAGMTATEAAAADAAADDDDGWPVRLGETKAEDQATTGAVVGTLFGQYAARYGVRALRDYHARLVARLFPVFEAVEKDPALAGNLVARIVEAGDELAEAAK